MSAPADDLPQRLRDCYDGCPAEVTTAPVALLREAADQLQRDEEHYQAAMRMSEKHRKNWVEASQRIEALEAAVAAAMVVRNGFVAACNAQERTYDADLEAINAFDRARAEVTKLR